MADKKDDVARVIRVVVVFRCRTCEHRNRMEVGTPGWEVRPEQFESLTAAWEHVRLGHEVEAYAGQEVK